MKQWLSKYGLILSLVIIMGLLGVIKPQFFSLNNLINIVRQISINGMLAVGVTLVLLTGGVDLSLGSLVALSGVVAALFARMHEYPVLLPVSMGLLTGVLCGLLNGVIIAKGRVAPFIVTLGMMTVARGLALVISGGKPVSQLSKPFLSIGNSEIAGFPLIALIFIGVVILVHIFLKNIQLGRYLYAIGGNEEAAYASGIRVEWVKIFAYGACGLFAGLAGVVLASRITTGQPNAGMAYELDAIAAAVIGGTSLSGGVGGVMGTLLGALLMGVINNGLDLLNVSSYFQQIAKGVIIIAAVWLDRQNRR